MAAAPASATKAELFSREFAAMTHSKVQQHHSANSLPAVEQGRRNQTKKNKKEGYESCNQLPESLVRILEANAFDWTPFSYAFTYEKRRTF